MRKRLNNLKMKNMKITVSVGIPSYNEEANIKNLLQVLLNQALDGFELKAIIVVSDGSTDRTVELVRSVQDERIKLIEFTKRNGAEKAQNKIIKVAKGDILVMLDADVLPETENFILNIIKPILKDNKVGLVGADTKSFPSRNLSEKIIAESHEFKKNIYKNINRGNNIYLCHGRARAFSQAFYTQIRWPECGGAEDAFSYLSCIDKGFKFIFEPSASVRFRSPQVLSDHLLQSRRFIRGRKLMESYFHPQFVRNEYKIPLPLILKHTILFFLKNTFLTTSFILIHLYARLTLKSFHEPKWEIAKSTKILN